MLRNYLKIALRTLIRNKAFSLINVAGLTLGMSCSLLIILWVRDERGVDGFHKNGSRLYQVYERSYFDGKINTDYPTQGLLGEELKRVVPEVEFASGLESGSAPGTLNAFGAGDKTGKMGGSFASADFLRMFSFPLLQGSVNDALAQTGGIAISRKMAEYFFGNPVIAMGKALRFENDEELKVTAVFENLPVHSSLQFDYLRPWQDFVRKNDWVHNWGNTDPATYVLLRNNTDERKVEKEIRDFIYRYQGKDASFRMELGLQSFPERYLHSNFKNGHPGGGRIEYVRIFTLVAFFILLIACINFMNLATALSANRSKEVGLRKVIGAVRSGLIFQFIGEAILLVILSVLLALLVTNALIPAFNSLTGKQLSLPIGQPLFWLLLLGLVVLTGVVAGGYPALFLSSLKPVKVLKESLKFGKGATFFRQGLVIFQFVLSIMLISGMIVVYSQVHFIQTRNLGYDRQNLLYIPIEGELVKSYSVFKEEALKVPGVINISRMRNTPTVIGHHTGNISWPGKDPGLSISFADGVVGYEFVKTMKLELKEGRDFSQQFGSDTANYIINETAAKRIGFKEAIGQMVVWGNHPGRVIGVLKDFHFNSLHQPIEPLILRLDEHWPWGTVLLRAQAGTMPETIAGLQKIYKSLNPAFPFTYQFSDLEYARLYQSEAMVGKLSWYFAFLAVFISCMGLFGLATFTALQRRKEIGVRKVLGATVPDIVIMLTGYFMKLILAALIIALPMAWITMKDWLGQFSYKIDMEWWMFGLAALLAFLIGLLAVGYQSSRAALNNPVDSLRTE